MLDHYLGAGRPTSWEPSGSWRRAARTQTAEAAGAGPAASATRTSGPSLPLARYAGTYRDAWYGDVTIDRRAGDLVIRFAHTPSLVGDLEHWQYDTFLARWRDRELRADAYVTFALNPDGTIEQARMAPASPAVDFSFDFQDLLLRPVSR